MENETTLPILSFEAIRVLGVLIEKSKTTPDNYPLTLNSLVLGCNQKSSRFPVVEFDENTVSEALDELKKQGFSQTVVGDGRSVKYRHSIASKFSLDPVELTLLALLFLRGPQTPGELKTNAGRMYEFESLEEANTKLHELMQAETPFIQQLEKQAGKKEARFMHLFTDQIPTEENAGNVQVVSSSLSLRVEELEAKVASLEEKLMELWRELKE